MFAAGVILLLYIFKQGCNAFPSTKKIHKVVFTYKEGLCSHMMLYTYYDWMCSVHFLIFHPMRTGHVIKELPS